VGPLSSVFVAALDAKVSAQAKAIRDLEEQLRDTFDASRGVWPEIVVRDRDFVRHLAGCMAGEPNLQAALRAIRGPDLYLAFACASGDNSAIVVFERDLLLEVRPALSRMRLDRSTVDDVKQLVRQKLLMRDGATPPKIAEYAGRGPLESWVRVVAARTALTLLRKSGKISERPLAESALRDVASGASPEIDLVRARYAGEFTAALEETLKSLPAHDRTVLRLHFVDGLNIEQIGVIYRVHRSTVARWIARSRGELLEQTRAILAKRLRLTESEFGSLMGAVRSQLHMSLHRVLGDDDP
jgi:RNA polymerase sigma-70 factor (ECF subfamily)